MWVSQSQRQQGWPPLSLLDCWILFKYTLLPFDKFGGLRIVVTWVLFHVIIDCMFLLGEGYMWINVYNPWCHVDFANDSQSLPFPSRFGILGGRQINTSYFVRTFVCVLIHFTNHNCQIRTVQVSQFLTVIIRGHCRHLEVEGNDYG